MSGTRPGTFRERQHAPEHPIVNAATSATPGHRRSAGFAARDVAVKPARARQRSFTFWCLMTFFLLEYMRPEPIVQLKLQMLFLILFPILWIRESRRPWSRNLTFQSAFLVLSALSMLYATNYYSAYMVTRAVYGYVVIALAITWFLSNRRDFT